MEDRKFISQKHTAMPISYQYKTIFIHIPKCGGTSIEKMLGMASENDLYSIYRLYNSAQIHIPREKFNSEEYTRCLAKTPQHLNLIELKKIVDPFAFDTFSKFAIVRNPFSRIVSEYKYLKSLSSHPDITDFSSLVGYLSADAFKKMHRFDGHLGTQTSFLINELGQIDESIKIYKFENIEECFRDILKISPVQIPLHSKKNKDTTDYRDYYTPELVKIVQEFYEADFKNFNYSMEL